MSRLFEKSFPISSPALLQSLLNKVNLIQARKENPASLGGESGPTETRRFRLTSALQLKLGRERRRSQSDFPMANYLSTEKKIRILELLIEGNYVRGTARLCDTNIKTVLRQLVECGEKARQFLHENLRRINVGHVQCDEIWTFVQKKQARIKPEERENVRIGDQYLFVALDTDSKLVCTYALGKRDQNTTDRFVEDLARRIVVAPKTGERPQISTDGWTCYPDAIESSFGHRVDYGQIIKVYANEQSGRYAPPEVVESVRKPMWGVANLKWICTSHVERFNLAIRTFMKRFARLSLGFSKKLDNLRAAVALHVFHYNYCRVHSSLRSTPAMKAKLTDRLWKLEDLFAQAA